MEQNVVSCGGVGKTVWCVQSGVQTSRKLLDERNPNERNPDELTDAEYDQIMVPA